MAQNIIIKFQLDGIDQSISSVTSLNGEVSSLKTNFVETTTAANNAGKAVSETSSQISDSLGSASNSSSVLNENLSNVENQSKTFGGNLVKATKESGKAVLALSNGIEFLGLQGQEVDKVSKALLILSELMKAQELISEKAFSGKGIKEQLKSLGQLIIGRRADTAATLANAGAQAASATATAGAATATRGLSAAMAATPWGVILIVIGAVIAAYELLKNATIDNTENIQNQIDIFNIYNDTVKQATENLNDFANIEIKNQVAALEKQLALVQAQNGSIQDQYALQVQILNLKQQQIQQEIDQQTSIKNNTSALNELYALREQSLKNEQEILKDNSKTTEDYTKAVDKTKTIEKEITTEKQRQTDAGKKILELQGQLDTSKEFDLKILQANTAEQEKQLKIQREQFFQSVQNRIEQSKKIVIDAKFEIDQEEIKNQIKELESVSNLLWKLAFPKDGFEKILSETLPQSQDALKLIVNNNIKIIKEGLQVELNEYIKTENDKRDTALQGLQDKVKADQQSLKYDKLTNQQKKALQNDITENQRAQLAIQLQTENNIAAKRTQIINKLQDELLNNNLIGNDSRSFFSQNINEVVALENEVNSFKEKLSQLKDENGNNTQLGFLTQAIEQTKKLLDGDTLSAEKRKQLENNLTLYFKRESEIRLGIEKKTNEEREKLWNELTDKIIANTKNQDQLLQDFLKNDNLNALLGNKFNFKKFFEENSPEFKLFEDKLNENLTNSLNILESSYSDTFKNIIDKQNFLDKELERGNIFRIANFIKERKAILKQSESSGEELIKEAKKQQDAIIEIIKNSGLSDLMKEVLINSVNKQFDNFIKNIKVSLKNLKSLTKEEINGILGQLVQYTRALSDSIFYLLDSINEYKNAKDEERKDALNKEIDDLREAEQQKLDIIAASQSKINDLESQLSSARGNRHAYLLSLLATEFRHKREADLQAQELHKKQIERENEIAEIEKEATKRALKIDRARAIVQGILGAIEAYTSLASIPYVGPILGGIAAAAVVAATAIQVSTIDQQLNSLAKGGPIKADGGLVDGPSHQEGGVRGTGRFANIEVEGDEYVVNKKSTKRNFGIIDMLNKDMGKTNFMLVPQNSSFASTNKLQDGALLPDFNKIENAVAVQKQDLTPIVDAIRELNVEVSVVDINKGQNRVTKIKELSRI